MKEKATYLICSCILPPFLLQTCSVHIMLFCITVEISVTMDALKILFILCYALPSISLPYLYE